MWPEPRDSGAPGRGNTGGNAKDHQGAGSTTILASGTHTRPADTLSGEFTTPDLATMAPRAQRIALEWFELGRLEGFEAGYRQCEADDAARWAELRKSIRAAANSPDYATLCRRRGDHARAEATERLWQERGVA